MKLLAIGERRWSSERLHQAIAATRGGKARLVLLLENQEYFKTFTLDYTEGEKYPHLERTEGKADLLTEIFRPRVRKESR
jgi:hypothetical protein